MKRIICILALATMALVLGAACAGAKGDPGEQGVQGQKGDAGTFAWWPAENVSETITLLPGQVSEGWEPRALKPGDRVEYSWSAIGNPANCHVTDPWHCYYTGGLDPAGWAFEGGGAYIAAAAGDYVLEFSANGLVSEIHVTASVYRASSPA